MGAADQILAAIGGGLSGGARGYQWAEEFDQKDREIDNKKEVARLQGEIRMMLESMKETGRNERYATPSGNVVAQQAGATQRNTDDNETTVAVADGRNAVTTRGQDITQSLGIARNDTTRRGQDLNFTLGGMRNSTALFGIKTGAETTRRGQDMTSATAANAEAGRGTRATDVNKLRSQEIEQRERLEKSKRADPWSGVTFDQPGGELKDGTGRPTATPIEVKEKPTPTSSLPVVVRSPEAAGDQSARLEQQATGLITQFRAEKDPAKKAALRTQLQRVRDQLVAAQAKPGGE